MFVIMLKYIKPIEIVDQYLVEHRAYLDECYQKNGLIASGPQIPRSGGIMLSQLKDRPQLEALLHQDPFWINEVAEYTIIEFDPVKYHKHFAVYL